MARLGVALGGGGLSPMLTEYRAGQGRVLVLNVRTFSEQDFRETGEWLLAKGPGLRRDARSAGQRPAGDGPELAKG